MTSEISFFVCAHVDTGKSSLIGNLLYLTGSVRTLEESGKRGCKFSDLLDIEKSERERGNTQSSSIREFNYKNNNFCAIDTPGHSIYIRDLINTINIYSNERTIPCLLLSGVFSEFESMFKFGTTKEDVLLIRGCGFNHLVVCINKIDKISDLDELNRQYNLIKTTFNNFLNTSFVGFKSVTYIPISAYCGTNLITPDVKINSMLECEDNTTFLDTLIAINQKIIKKQSTIIHKEIISKTKNKCKIIFSAFNIPNIITLGFECIYHFSKAIENHTEMVGTISKIHDIEGNSKRFLKTGDIVNIFVIFNENMLLSQDQRVILRFNEITLGFGRITFN